MTPTCGGNGDPGAYPLPKKMRSPLRAALAWNESQNLKIARFDENMRNDAALSTGFHHIALDANGRKPQISLGFLRIPGLHRMSLNR